MTDQRLATNFVVVPDIRDMSIDVVADVGNAESLVLVRRGDQVVSVAMPAYRTLAAVFSAELFEQRGLPAPSWDRLAKDEHVIKVGGIERYLGRLAVESGVAIGTGRGSDVRYADGTTMQFILASVAAALPHECDITARLVALLPISLWSKHADQVHQALKKTHQFEYNGRMVRIRFVDVLVRRECETAFDALPIKPMGRTLLLDGGGRTFNVGLFFEGRYGNGFTIDNLGVEFVLDSVDKELAYTNARALTPAERKGLLRALKNGEEYRISVHGHGFRIDPIARVHFDSAAVALVQELHARVRMEQVQVAYFLGGAAYPAFFGAKVIDQLDLVQLAAEPETMNAHGALTALGGPVTKKTKKLR